MSSYTVLPNGRLKVIKSIQEMILYRKDIESKKTVGFVPTMGYLHQGHLSLVKKAQEDNDIVIVSIFVNPSQFGVGEDFDKYPRDLDRDLNLLYDYNVDVVFYPEYTEMYPENFKTWVEVYDIGNLLCGASRPGHFKGVATIVNKLVNICRPDFMYMGEKDFQQIFILKKMLDDLNISTKIVSCPIIREKDGLAMSSRNVYLNTQERENAVCLFHSLLTVKEMFFNKEYSVETIKTRISQKIKASGGVIDYIAFIDDSNFENVSEVSNNTRVLLAVKFGNTRLIDNMKMT